MSGWSGTRVRLTDYLRALRAELSKVREQADEDNLPIDLNGASIEIDIAYSLEQSERPEFWVLAPPLEVEAKDETGAPHRDRQRLTVRLTPGTTATADESPNPAPTPLPRAPMPKPKADDDE